MDLADDYSWIKNFPHSKAKAAFWYHQLTTLVIKKAKAGNLGAEEYLSTAAAPGHHAEKIAWLYVTACRHDPFSQLILGRDYLFGIDGLPEKPVEARLWLDQAGITTWAAKFSGVTRAQLHVVAQVLLLPGAKALEASMGPAAPRAQSPAASPAER